MLVALEANSTKCQLAARCRATWLVRYSTLLILLPFCRLLTVGFLSAFMASETPETNSLPPVSALRSRFEQLAFETSPKAASTSQFETNNYLSPGSNHARRRTSSNASEVPESPSQSTHNLRTSVSSSDLKGAKRKPPPPPTSSRPQTASTSTQTPSYQNGFSSSALTSPSHSAQGTVSNMKPPSIPRKPPPPPARHGQGLESEAAVATGGNASPRSKYS